MTINELEALLEGSAETPSLEFKAAMNWDKNSLTKDILAMANVQDGGTIVIGVADGTFDRQGLTAEQIATYNIDTMKDQVAPFADPFVDFRVSFPRDGGDRTYVVIEVMPFSEAPVICARDGQDVHQGIIYYRSSDKRPQSARVATSHDMRDILERAIVRRRAKLVQIGLIANEAIVDALDAELGGL